MKEQLAKLRLTLRRWSRRIAVHGRALGLAAGAVAACAGLLAVGFAARRQAAATHAEIIELRRTVALMAEWEAGFQPAESGESQTWRASERRLRELGVVEADRIALARGVAERLELAGAGDAVLSFEETTGDVPPYVPAGVGWVVEPGPFALSVRLHTDLGTVLDLLRILPPQVRVQRLDLARAPSGGVEARMLLSTYYVSGLDETALGDAGAKVPRATPESSAPVASAGSAGAGGALEEET